MRQEILSPSHRAGALAHELAISSMSRALKHLPGYVLEDPNVRVAVYLTAQIPLPHIYQFDEAALEVERIRRRVCSQRDSGLPSLQHVNEVA